MKILRMRIAPIQNVELFRFEVAAGTQGDVLVAKEIEHRRRQIVQNHPGIKVDDEVFYWWEAQGSGGIVCITVVYIPRVR